MPGSANFELVGVEAIVLGIAAFERDVSSINRLLAQVQNTTSQLASGGGNAFSAIGNVSTAAFGAIVAGAGAATIALAGVSAGMVEVAASFEQNLLRVGSVLGTTTEQFAGLESAVIRVGDSSRVSLTDITDATNQLARAGIDLSSIEGGVLDATVKLAEASGGQLGLASAANLVSEGMLAWGLNASQVTGVTSTLLAIANSSSIGFDNLQSIFRQTAPIAAGLGISIQDLGAAIGIMGQAGISGFISGSALKDVLVKLADPSKQALTEMKKYGVSLEDANHQVVSMREIIVRLNAAFGDQAVASGKVTEATRAQALALLFGTRGIEAGIALARGGTAAFDKFAATIASTDPTALADKMRDSLIPQLDVLRNVVQGLVIEIGKPLEQALTKGVEAVNAFLRTLDPRVPRAFGDALLSIFSGRGAGAIGEELQNALGTSLGGVVSGLVNIFIALRNALVDQLLPAMVLFLTTISAGVNPVQSFGGFLQTIATVIGTVSARIAEGIVLIGNLIAHIRDAATTSDILALALKVLAVVPLVGLVVVFGQIAFAIGTALAPVVALSAAIVLLRQHTDDIATAFATLRQRFNDVVTTIQSVITAYNNSRGAQEAVSAEIAIAIGLLIRYIGLLAIDYVTAAAAAVASTSVMVGALAVANIEIFIIVGAILALVAIIIAAQAAWDSNWLGIREAVTNAITPMLPTIQTLATAIGDILLTALGILIVTVRLTITAIEALPSAFNKIIGAVGAVIDSFDRLIGFTKRVPDTFISAGKTSTDTWTTIESIINRTVTAIIRIIEGFFAELRKIPIVATILDKLGDTFKALHDEGSKAIDSLSKSVSGSVDDMEKTIQRDREEIARQFALLAQNAQSGLEAAKGFVIDFAQTTIVQMDEAGIAISRVAAAIGGVQGAIAQANFRNSRNNTRLALEGDFPPLPPDSVTIPSTLGGFGGDDSSIGFPTPITSGGGGGGGSGSESKLEKLKDTFEKLLSILPGDTKALAAFLAQLETDVPGRMNAMVGALTAARGTLEQMSASYQRILVLNQAISSVQADINRLDAQKAQINLNVEQQTLPIQQQINALDVQRLAIEQQIAPIKARIAAIDTQIATLERVNFDLERQRLQLVLQELPIQQQIAAIDVQINAAQRTNYDAAIALAQIDQQELPLKQQLAALAREITDAQRVNYDRAISLAVLDQQALPIKQRIADLETQINRVVDQRGQLLARQSEILAQQSVDNLNSQLRGTQEKLDAAWKVLNVPQILALEAQKNSLSDTIVTAQDQLTAIQDQQKITSQNDELKQIALKLQIVDQQKLLDAITDQTTAITNQQAIEDAATKLTVLNIQKQQQAIQDALDVLDTESIAITNQQAIQDAATKIIVLNLQKQKQALEDLLVPIQAQIVGIQNIQAAQTAQNALAINDLQQQKAALEDLVAPMQVHLDGINNQIAALRGQIDAITALAQEELTRLDIKLNQDKIELASLDAIKQDEQDRFDKLAEGFLSALVDSKAFTVGEAAEVLKRLGFTDTEIQRIAELASTFNGGGPGSVTGAIADVTRALIDIPDKTVHIHIVTDQIPTFEYGGVVGGPIGSPQLIIAHGGEQFLGVHHSSPLFTQQAGVGNGAQQVNNYTTYEVNATYTQQQSPASVAMDIRALQAMVRK